MVSDTSSQKPRRAFIVVAAAVFLVLFAVGYVLFLSPRPTSQHDLRLSVPPFVDTAMTVAGVKENAFSDLPNHLIPVATTWENQYDTLTGGGLDISMSTLDEFVNKSANLRKVGQPVVFILPAWKFRGLGFYASPGVRPLSQFSGAGAKDQFLAQFKNRKIVIPEGSVFEQALRSFLSGTLYRYEDLPIVNAPLDSALNSLGDASVAIAAVGSQQRFAAERRGYKEAISPEDLGLDVITGFIVPEKLYRDRPGDVVAFACGWYATAKLVAKDPSRAYQVTNDYLVGRGATSLTFDEYRALTAYDQIPDGPSAAEALFISPSGTANWRKLWDRSVQAMQVAGRGAQAPADTSGFIAPSVIGAAKNKCG